MGVPSPQGKQGFPPTERCLRRGPKKQDYIMLFVERLSLDCGLENGGFEGYTAGPISSN
jgi:hypothetical protein